MQKTTRIKDAAWVLAWNGRRHVYLRGADVVFSGNTITHVGRGYTGEADDVVDGSKLCVLPGFVNIHTHPFCEPLYRGIREEHGTPNLYMTGLYERSQAFQPDEEGQAAAAEVAYCELLLSGVTTVVDLSSAYDGWLDLTARSGLRGFLAPGFASAKWSLENDHVLGYRWDEKRGWQKFEEALSLIDSAVKHPSGRLSGVVSPSQIDTCTPDLLKASVEAARDRKLSVTTHAAQSVVEFQEMVRRHGKTPIQFAESVGILGPDVILAHCIFIDEHSWLHWWSRRDIALLAESGTTVAHCPTPFARYGHTLENLGKYLRAGVNVGLGTDVAPHNILEEMRTAIILGRISAGDITALTTADIFDCATINGARAVGRDDLGRLEAGARADIVVADLENPFMMPARDPLRGLVYTAAERAVRDVYVDGNMVVENHQVVTLDHAGALARATEAQRRMEATTGDKDYLKRSATEIVPPSLEMSGEL